MLYYNDDYSDNISANNTKVNNTKANKPKIFIAISICAVLFFIITVLPTGYYALMLFAGLFTPLFLVYSICAITILLILFILPFLTLNYKSHLKLILGFLITVPVLAIISFIAAYNLYYTAFGCIAYFVMTLPIACINLVAGVIFLPLIIFLIRYIKSLALK